MKCLIFWAVKFCVVQAFSHVLRFHGFKWKYVWAIFSLNVKRSVIIVFASY